MNIWDGISIVACAALAGSWVWLRRKHLSYSGWRRKASLAALECVSLAVVLDLMNTGIMRFVGMERVVHWVGLALFRSIFSALFAVTGTMAFLALILGLLGKGSPRILALGWLCVLLIPNASILPSLVPTLYREWHETASIRSRLRTLAGQGAINCGRVKPWTDTSASSDCVLHSFENKSAFYVIYAEL